MSSFDFLSFINTPYSRILGINNILKSKDTEQLKKWYAELASPSTFIHQLAKCAIAAALRIDQSNTIQSIASYLMYFPLDVAALWCRVHIIMTNPSSELTLSMAIADIMVMNQYVPEVKKQTLSMLGKINFMVEKYEQSEIHLREAISYTQDFLFEETYLLAHLYTVHLNNPALGETFFKKIIDNSTTSLKQKQAAYFGISVVYAKQGDYAMSIAVINSALKVESIRANDEVIFLHWMFTFKICWYDGSYNIPESDIDLLLSSLKYFVPRSKKTQCELLMTRARFGPRSEMRANLEAANLICGLKNEDYELLTVIRTGDGDDTASSYSIV